MESWAVVSFRIDSGSLTVEEIERLLGKASNAKSADHWSADLGEDGEARLDDQLRIAKAWIAERSEVLRTMSDADICLTIGWTPRDPQDGIIMDRELIGLLHSMRAYVLLDTYQD